MFSNKIKKLRNERKLSQAELAKRFNVVQQTVGKWEKGITYPSVEMLSELATFFGVSTDYLLDREPVQYTIITPAESDMLTSYRSLNASKRSIVDNMIQALSM